MIVGKQFIPADMGVFQPGRIFLTLMHQKAQLTVEYGPAPFIIGVILGLDAAFRALMFYKTANFNSRAFPGAVFDASSSLGRNV